MSELMVANLVIANRSYRIRLNPEDEETVRGSVKLINDKIAEFKSAYAGKDLQDYISMVLLWFATEQTKPAQNMLMKEATIQQLNHIESLIDKVLEE